MRLMFTQENLEAEGVRQGDLIVLEIFRDSNPTIATMYTNSIAMIWRPRLEVNCRWGPNQNDSRFERLE